MKKQRKLNGGAKMGFLFALPAAIYMMVFIGYPMIQNLILSFKNVDVYSFAQPDNQVFVGLQNYIELFTSGNSILTKSIANTFSSSLSLVLHWHCYSIRNLPDVLSSEV